MKPNAKTFFAGLLLVVGCATASLCVATNTTGDISRYAMITFFILIMCTSLFGFAAMITVMLRAAKSGFGFPKTAADWNRFAKPMMWLSAAFIVLGVVFAIRSAIFLRTAQPAEGTIIELLERESDEGGTTFAPVYTFVDASGHTNRIISSVSSSPPIGLVGDKIRVLYNPKNPSTARINRFFDLWGISAIGGGLGSLYLLVFWIVAKVSKRKMGIAEQNLRQVSSEPAPCAAPNEPSM
jgi:hypothetical protein